MHQNTRLEQDNTYTFYTVKYVHCLYVETQYTYLSRIHPLKQKRFKHATPIVLSILGGEQRAERDRVRCQGGARVEPGGGSAFANALKHVVISRPQLHTNRHDVIFRAQGTRLRTRRIPGIPGSMKGRLS